MASAQEEPTIQLIVNADDYGFTAGVSAGIREAHLHGIVTSTTAMMNMPAVEEGLLLAVSQCPRLGLGVHLVLTAGVPVLPVAQVSSLTQGSEYFPDEMGLISSVNQLDPMEVKAEWQAQIEKFVQITGRTPDHLDSHHHVSYFTPNIFRVMLDLARTYQSAIRLPVGQAAAEMLGEFSPDFIKVTLTGNQSLLKEYHPRHPDTFIKSFYNCPNPQAELLEILTTLHSGSTEIMCHPGYVDDELRRSCIYLEPRARELDAMTSIPMLELVKEKHIQLINFAQLI